MNFDQFIGSSYESQSPTADTERTVNWFVERIQSENASVKKALWPAPGVLDITNFASGSSPGPAPGPVVTVSGGGRAHFFEDGREFAVIGDSLVEYDAVGTGTDRGTVTLGDAPATISSNGDAGGQLFITSGNNGYVYTLATNVLAAVAALAGKAGMGGYIDGYFVCLDTSTSTLLVSALLDGSSWTTGTDFAQRNFASDPWINMDPVGRNIWLFGERTTEVWFDTGATFPFAPTDSGFLQVGIAAPASSVVIGEAIIWLGADKNGRLAVYRSEGMTPTPISTFPLETAIGSYTRIDDAVGDSYSHAGHTFYSLSFDSAGITWSWDESNGLWCERGTWDADQGEFESWHPRFHAFAFNQHRILDSRTPSLYVLGDFPSDAGGRLIRRVRRAPSIASDNQRMFYSDFELSLEVGVGAAGAILKTIKGNFSNENPHIILRLSNDCGKTWAAELMRPIGKSGEYRTRVRWNRLGSSRQRVFEVVCTDNAPWRVTGASMNVEREEA